MAEVSLAKFPLDWSHWILLIISRHWFRWWLVTIRQQAITWAKCWLRSILYLYGITVFIFSFNTQHRGYTCFWNSTPPNTRTCLSCMTNAMAADDFQIRKEPGHQQPHIEFVLLEYSSFITRRVHHIDGLVQERRSSSALALELRLSCTKPSIY